MEHIAELKTNLKDKLHTSSSSSVKLHSVASMEKGSTELVDEDSYNDKLSRIVKPFLEDKIAVKDKKVYVPFIGPPTARYNSDDEIQNTVKQESRKLRWLQMSSELLNEEELFEFCLKLEKYATPAPEDSVDTESDKLIAYKDYKRFLQDLDPRVSALLSVQVFMRLIGDDPYGRVPVNLICNYVIKKIWLKQTRLGLVTYDWDGRGFITEEGFQLYFSELIPTLHQSDVDPEIAPFYICIATRKFFFFLDTLGSGKIKIIDILSSGLIDEILDLRDKEIKRHNWFSYKNALSIYKHFVSLDKDHNGKLSPKEFMSFGYGTRHFTPEFVNRLFSEITTYNGDMDFKTFVDFNLAFENLNEPRSIDYFFRVLDINHKGYLDAFDVNYFIKGVETMHRNAEINFFNFVDLKDSLIYMMQLEDPEGLKITAKDLIKCGMSEEVIKILIDMYAGIAYDNKVDNRGSSFGATLELEPESIIDHENEDVVVSSLPAIENLNLNHPNH